MALENTTPERIEELVRKQRAFFATGTTRDIEWRRHQLREFRNGLQRWEKPLCDALWKDLHKSYEEAYMTEIGLVYGEIREATGKVGRWARKRWKPTSMAVLPSSSYIVREPLGSTLILSPWNYPVQLLLNPLVGAIAAGCTAILKPSPYVPNVSKVLEDMIADIFEEDYVAVVQGNRTVNSELFKHRYDLVFLTGSPSLGRIAMEAQAKYLTPMVARRQESVHCRQGREPEDRRPPHRLGQVPQQRPDLHRPGLPVPARGHQGRLHRGVQEGTRRSVPRRYGAVRLLCPYRQGFGLRPARGISERR